VWGIRCALGGRREPDGRAWSAIPRKAFTFPASRSPDCPPTCHWCCRLHALVQIDLIRSNDWLAANRTPARPVQRHRSAAPDGSHRRGGVGQADRRSRDQLQHLADLSSRKEHGHSGTAHRSRAARQSRREVRRSTFRASAVHRLWAAFVAMGSGRRVRLFRCRRPL
jgi:hypothetical protein